MKEFSTQPPSGTRDFLPEDTKSRERALSIIKGVFERFSFLPMDTPALERIETLTNKYGEEGEKLIFKILKRGEQAVSGEADLALRYDLTVPLARYYARYRNQLPRPFRRYQIAPVWRADRPGKGRFREFYQCDVDVVGSSSLLSDAEVILALVESLSSLNLTGYIVYLNSRKVLAGILEAYDVPDELRGATLTALDKLDRIGVNGVSRELEVAGISETIIDQVKSDLFEKSEELKGRISASLIGREGLEEVDEVMSLVTPLLKNGKIEFSPFLARGLDYYTGPIFEIYLRDAAVAIASGGRYDSLIGMFVGEQIPACGGSLGIDRILSTVEQVSKQDEQRERSRVFITVWDHTFRAETLRIADELRNEGISTEISLDEGKIGDQVRSALKRGALYCLFYGPDEAAKSEITLKDLSVGKQMSVKRDRIAQTLKSLTQRR